MMKPVDKSVLRDGFNIPISMQKAFYETTGNHLEHGESKVIKIDIDGATFQAKLTNINFNRNQWGSHSDLLQIRYSSGSPLAKKLKEKFGTPYETFYPLDEFDARRFREAHGGKRILIVHQQILADALRRELENSGGCEKISVASWFRMDGELMREGDVRLEEEDDLLRFVEAGSFDTVVGDPLFVRALYGWRGDFAPLPHFAVSGSLHAAEREEDFWHGLCA